ncbi:retrotransposon protein, putative, ty1-copia subclass [Tanacetum coccineum]
MTPATTAKRCTTLVVVFTSVTQKRVLEVKKAEIRSSLFVRGQWRLCTNYEISVSKNYVLYFNVIPSDGIYEIDMLNLVPNVNSIYSDCYFITFMDDYSRYGYVYLPKHKHEVFETFKVFKNEVENQLGQTIKALQSDRGGEYISQEFKDYLKACGIVQQLTPPYTPQHNRVSERRNYTLLDMVRSMMNLTTMSLSFWDYALETATRILNKRHHINYGMENFLTCLCVEKSFVSRNQWEGEELEEIQDKDTSPSENTSEIPMEVEGFEPPQEEVIPVRRSARTHRAPNPLCLNVKVKEHSLRDLNETNNYKAAILDLESNKWVDAIKHDMESYPIIFMDTAYVGKRDTVLEIVNTLHTFLVKCCADTPCSLVPIKAAGSGGWPIRGRHVYKMTTMTGWQRRLRGSRSQGSRRDAWHAVIGPRGIYVLSKNASVGDMKNEVDISMLTMEQYIALIPDDIKPGIVNLKIGDDVKFEINTNFMRKLRHKLFAGTDGEDAYEHVSTVLEIVDLFHLLGVTHDAIMLMVFPITLKGRALRWKDRLPAGSITTWDLLKKNLFGDIVTLS